MVVENTAERGAEEEQRYQRRRHRQIPNYLALSHVV